jgi:hypothetical protein
MNEKTNQTLLIEQEEELEFWSKSPQPLIPNDNLCPGRVLVPSGLEFRSKGGILGRTLNGGI